MPNSNNAHVAEDDDKRPGESDLRVNAICPSAQHVGVALGTLGQSIKAALVTLSLYASSVDEKKPWVMQALEERFERIPLNRIITPDLAIAGPLIESMRFTGDKSPLRELYANLLATSMDSETAKHAHPAFVEVIRQLSPDEARILDGFRLESVLFLVVLSAPRNAPGYAGTVQTPSDWRIFKLPEQPISRDLIPSYLGNLERLGLIIQRNDCFGPGFPQRGKGYGAELDSISDAARVLAEAGGEVKQHYSRILLTDFGYMFFRACIAPHEEQIDHEAGGASEESG